jgi:chromosome segregation ATPase
MDLNKTQIKLEELAVNIDELLNRYKLLEANHNAVAEENKKLKSLLEEKNQQLNDFQYKSKISKIVQYLAVDDLSADELRTKIDEYIKEIDNCLAYLSREV